MCCVRVELDTWPDNVAWARGTAAFVGHVGWLRRMLTVDHGVRYPSDVGSGRPGDLGTGCGFEQVWGLRF